MDIKKLDKWASLLLDTGKRNNLVNFKDRKSSTVEIILPSPNELFDKVDSSASFEVFDPMIADYDEEDISDEESLGNEIQTKLSRQEYIDTYSSVFHLLVC